MEALPWKKELSSAVRNLEQLERHLSLTEEEVAFFERRKEERPLPFQVTGYYLSLMTGIPDDPVRKQCIPRAAEFLRFPGETDDPLHEGEYSPLPRLVRRYRDRALIRVNDSCAVYCRHCFRRCFTGGAAGAISRKEVDAIAVYLRNNTEIKEVLLSGGDPLLLDDHRLEGLLAKIRYERPDLLLRLATRTPVTLPSRITGDLVSLLRGYFPLWVVTQFNHPAELTARSSAAMAAFREAGIPCLNQAVLLRGVNDSADVLETLFRGLALQGIKPYYLFQGDLAEGTGHFRVPLRVGWSIIEELRLRLSGLALPVYAVDLPGGGGKIRLEKDHLIKETEDCYVFRNIEGKEYTYPKED
ncbi:MAG: KamA family radical SAM protein [Spirochaetales bacterium]|nr:KamA family radical SAM protein [Spirochaetales bacterium]